MRRSSQARPSGSRWQPLRTLLTLVAAIAVTGGCSSYPTHDYGKVRLTAAEAEREARNLFTSTFGYEPAKDSVSRVGCDHVPMGYTYTGPPWHIRVSHRLGFGTNERPLQESATRAGWTPFNKDQAPIEIQLDYPPAYSKNNYLLSIGNTLVITSPCAK